MFFFYHRIYFMSYKYIIALNFTHEIHSFLCQRNILPFFFVFLLYFIFTWKFLQTWVYPTFTVVSSLAFAVGSLLAAHVTDWNPLCSLIWVPLKFCLSSSPLLAASSHCLTTFAIKYLMKTTYWKLVVLGLFKYFTEVVK